MTITLVLTDDDTDELIYKNITVDEFVAFLDSPDRVDSYCFYLGDGRLHQVLHNKLITATKHAFIQHLIETGKIQNG